MNTIEIASPPQNLAGRNDEKEKLNWQNNLPIQHLLDVISSILAKEYIMVAKQNPGMFSKEGDKK